MPTLAHNQLSDLDSKVLFEEYFELGTYGRLSSWIEAQGIINPRTLKPYSVARIRQRVYEYIIDNPDEARTKYIAMGENFASDDEQWNRYLVRIAMDAIDPTRHSKRRFFEWLERRGYGSRYQYLYADVYGLPELPETQWMCQNCGTINEIESQTCTRCSSPINYVPIRRYRRPK